MALVNNGAALLVNDADASSELIKTALALVRDTVKRKSLSENIRKMAVKNSDEVIAREVLKLVCR